MISGIFNTRITADNAIRNVKLESVRSWEAFSILNDDLQATKNDLYSSKWNETTRYLEEYSAARRIFEPQKVNFLYPVGIRHFSPEGEIHAIGIREQSTLCILETNADAAGSRPVIQLRKSRGYYTLRTAVSAGDVIGDIGASSHDGSAFRNITLLRTQAGSVGGAGEWQFFTSPSTATGLQLRFGILENGSVYIGNQGSALGTGATTGFLYIPTCAGVPSGTPSTIAGCVPMVYDTTNGRLYVYSGGAWRIH